MTIGIAYEYCTACGVPVAVEIESTPFCEFVRCIKCHRTIDSLIEIGVDLSDTVSNPFSGGGSPAGASVRESRMRLLYFLGNSTAPLFGMSTTSPEAVNVSPHAHAGSV